MQAVHCFKSSIGLLATVLITSKCFLQRRMVHPEVIQCQLRLIIMVPLGQMHSEIVSSLLIIPPSKCASSFIRLLAIRV